jgi:hypothetical protein
MKKTIAPFFYLLTAISFANAEEIIKSPGIEEERAVVNASKVFVKAIDAENYENSWTLFAPEMQKQIGKTKYMVSIKLLRSGLGDIQKRKLIALTFVKDLKDSPPGTYVALFLKSDFQRISGEEKVVLVKLQEKWMIYGYFFEKSVKFNQPSK